jgi:hypothetical protein
VQWCVCIHRLKKKPESGSSQSFFRVSQRVSFRSSALVIDRLYTYKSVASIVAFGRFLRFVEGTTQARRVLCLFGCPFERETSPPECTSRALLICGGVATAAVAVCVFVEEHPAYDLVHFTSMCV